jgi:hypothetical protein
MGGRNRRGKRVSAKKVAVFGHERSGNHFLMNTLALNFGYIAKPWWNLDFELGIDFHNPKALLAYLKKAHYQPIKNILKSHHHYGFIEPIMEYMSEQFFVFYIYRDPRDVLISNQKLIEKLGTDEGPRGLSISEFIRSAPRGRMMRYQKHQSENMVTRWREHVEPWLEASTKHKEIIPISYEKLTSEFDSAILDISRTLGFKPQRIARPDKTTNVINPGSGKSGGWRDVLSEEDAEFICEYVDIESIIF